MVAADPDLQIRGEGRGGGCHLDPEITGGPVSNFFPALWPQFCLKIRGGGGGAPQPLPWIRP